MQKGKEKTLRTDVGGNHKNHKLMKIPRKYQTGFLAAMDGRTVVHQYLHDVHVEMLADLGGEDRLSHIQVSLVERYIFLEFTAKFFENKIVKYIVHHNKVPPTLMSKWQGSINTLLGISRVLGLERKAKMIESDLATYLGKKRKKA